MTTGPRSGTILIIVAGVSALLASMALTFLVRMRSDVEESQALLQFAQAKIMLGAACNYVQESSRMGWDRYYRTGAPLGSQTQGKRADLDADYPIHEEAYGWIDARDGRTGPLDRDGNPFVSAGSATWPNIGSHVRCPMYRMAIPPWAVQLKAAYNPMVNDPSSPDHLYPLMRYPDPQPVVDNKWSVATRTDSPHPMKDDGSMRAAYVKHQEGDATPIVQTMGKSWFRVYRDGPATFLITCGAGGTDGFKDWNEVLSYGASDLFPGLAPYFESVRQSEIRLWYRIEWSAAVLETSYHNLHHEVARNFDHYLTWPPNSSHTWSGNSQRTQTWVRNPVGTIRWIQRLRTEPTHY